MPNSTRWPARKAAESAGSAEECTKTSPPSSRVRKPNPLSASYHLTLPVGTSETLREEELWDVPHGAHPQAIGTAACMTDPDRPRTVLIGPRHPGSNVAPASQPGPRPPQP